MKENTGTIDKMMENATEAIRKRFSDDLIAPYILSFFMWNWEVFFIATDEDLNSRATIKAITKEAFTWDGVLVPIFITGFFLFVWPKLTLKVRKTQRQIALELEHSLNDVEWDGTKSEKEIVELTKDLMHERDRRTRYTERQSKLNADAIYLARMMKDRINLSPSRNSHASTGDLDSVLKILNGLEEVQDPGLDKLKEEIKELKQDIVENMAPPEKGVQKTVIAEPLKNMFPAGALPVFENNAAKEAISKLSGLSGKNFETFKKLERANSMFMPKVAKKKTKIK